MLGAEVEVGSSGPASPSLNTHTYEQPLLSVSYEVENGIDILHAMMNESKPLHEWMVDNS